MAQMPADTCWVCHQSTDVEAPMFAHPVEPDTECQTCHVAGEVGALPADHAGRTDDQCQSCHEASDARLPTAPHDLASRVGMCTFCHGESAPSD
jgi:hypothetical protein